MDIDGLGGETVTLLVNNGLINNYADLYNLTKEEILPLDRMAHKSAENLIKGIAASKNIPFERVLFALGIRYVGETVAKKLARHYKNIASLSEATTEQLINVDEIGERIAASVVDFFGQGKNQALVEQLREKGVNLSISEEKLASQTDRLAGITFVVSGVFDMPRNELKKLIEDNGGKVSSSISSKTSYVVAGENMGPSKLQKAEQLGIPIISEDNFLEMVK